MRIFIALCLLFSLSCSPTEQQYGGVPQELQWNRYVTDNFEILSLDDAQGRYLYNNVENIKKWISWRWGMKDGSFRNKCKLICVPNSDLYEKLFSKKTPTWASDTVWLVTESRRWNTELPVLLTEVVLTNFETTQGRKLPLWCHRGMSVLNGKLPDIRTALALVRNVDVGTLMTTTTPSADFDARAAAFCLWARQENLFLDFLNGKSVDSSYNEKIQSYVKKLMEGPDYYLTW